MSNCTAKLRHLGFLAVPGGILLSGLVGCGGGVSDAGSGGGGSSSVGGAATADGGADSSGSGGDNLGDGGTAGGGASSGGSETASGGSETASGGSNLGGSGPDSGGSSAGGSGSGGASNSADCTLPTEIGDCDGAFLRFAFDSDAGVCIPFSYGGCGGNGNNFELLSECDTACREGTPTPTASCESRNDCTLTYAGCCGICEPMPLNSYSGVNHEYLMAVQLESAANCENIDCGACEPGAPESQNYSVTCEESHCTPIDIREEDELSSCTADADCILRTGLDCCESCTEESLVALNNSADLMELLCEGESPPCAACVLEIPDGIEALCQEGTCQVVRN